MSPDRKQSGYVPRGARRAVFVLLIVGLSLGCDQVTKLWAIDKLDVVQPITMLGETVRLQYTENPGSFLGFGSTWPPALRRGVLTGGVGVFLLAALLYALLGRKFVRAELAGLSLLVGGGLGNVLDRLFRDGIVVDFMNLGVGRLRTGVFNVADLLIEAGVVVLLVGWWQASRLEKAEKDAA